MATQVSLNSGAVASAGALALQTNGTTQAVSISTSQVATLAQNPILTSGTINGVAYLNGSNVLTTGSALSFDGTVVNNTGAAPNFRSTITGGSYYTNLAADGIYASGTDLYLLAPASKFISFYANNAEQMRLTSTGLKTKTTISVGDATPSTSGAGITFPATQSASTNANTLDDYEEGTWTPVVIGTTSSGTGTYSVQTGSYTKVGRLVTVVCGLAWSAHTGTGNIQITGLPFVNSGDISVGAVFASNMNFGTLATQLTAYVVGSDNNISFRGMINNASRADTTLDSSVDSLYITLSYERT
jgi:hypothetical protein